MAPGDAPVCASPPLAASGPSETSSASWSGAWCPGVDAAAVRTTFGLAAAGYTTPRTDDGRRVERRHPLGRAVRGQRHRRGGHLDEALRYVTETATGMPFFGPGSRPSGWPSTASSTGWPPGPGARPASWAASSTPCSPTRRRCRRTRFATTFGLVHRPAAPGHLAGLKVYGNAGLDEGGLGRLATRWPVLGELAELVDGLPFLVPHFATAEAGGRRRRPTSSTSAPAGARTPPRWRWSPAASVPAPPTCSTSWPPAAPRRVAHQRLPVLRVPAGRRPRPVGAPPGQGARPRPRRHAGPGPRPGRPPPRHHPGRRRTGRGRGRGRRRPGRRRWSASAWRPGAASARSTSISPPARADTDRGAITAGAGVLLDSAPRVRPAGGWRRALGARIGEEGCNGETSVGCRAGRESR